MGLVDNPSPAAQKDTPALQKDPKRHPSTSLSLADKPLDGVILRCWGVVFEVLGCAFAVPNRGLIGVSSLWLFRARVSS